MRFETFPSVLVLCSVLGLSACSSAPPYTKPSLELPAEFKEAALFAPANPAAADVPDAWWELFQDPELNALQARLLQGNLSLQASAAAVAAAQAALGSSRAGGYPSVGVSAAVTRTSNSVGSASNVPSTSYSAQAGLASWELDLWGRVADGVDAATARLQSSQATQAATRLSLQATLTQTYFSYRSAQALAQVLAQSVQANAKFLSLTQYRYQAGVAAAADVASAETQLKTVQSQQLEAQTQVAQLGHALAVLLGQPPAALKLASPEDAQARITLPSAPPVPLQLPSTLLERRPDIAAAERQVAAANAQIGVARAAYFPTLTLGAAAGQRSSDLDTLWQSTNAFWSIGPTLALTLFDGGARRAAVELAQANYAQTVASYKQTVLVALQEVEDNLSAAHALAQEVQLQEAALSAARRALDISLHQYRAGTVSYLHVVQAQTTALGVERSLLDVRNRHLAAVNQLLKNLAGRWAPDAG